MREGTFEHWLAFDERGPGERSDYPDIRKENISPVHFLTMEFTFKEVLETHPWKFNTASDCLRPMHEAERVVSDCPLLGSPFCQVEPQHHRATVPYRVEIILSTSRLFGFYKRTDPYEGTFALTNDPDFGRVSRCFPS